LPTARQRHYGRCLRLGFARYDEKELKTAVNRLARALPR
jgi:DNA-binding transcriptional MocR family regulator